MEQHKLKPLVRKPSEYSGESSRTLRVERVEEIEVGHEDEHSWAVSYSDLLMVLLSFFVVFFSFSENEGSEKNKVLKAIEASVNKAPNGGGPEAAGAKPVKSVATAPKSAPTTEPVLSQAKQTRASISAKIQKNIRDLKVLADKNDTAALEIRLPDDIFELGKFSANDRVVTFLKEINKVIAPYSSSIDVYIIGHADQQSKFRKNNMIQDNFSLSALRAASALDVMLRLGFPQKHIFVQGAADNERVSRSLSVKIIVNESH